MQIPAICFLSWIIAIIFASSSKKISIFALDQKLLTSYQQSYKSWWTFAGKTSTTLKSFKNKLIIRTSSLRATLPVTKFGWIVNISKQNKTGSLRPSFSDYSECYILYANKPTNGNYWSSKRYMIFSTCHYWSWTPLRRDG